jgi:hypothetical protein
LSQVTLLFVFFFFKSEQTLCHSEGSARKRAARRTCFCFAHVLLKNLLLFRAHAPKGPAFVSRVPPKAGPSLRARAARFAQDDKSARLCEKEKRRRKRKKKAEIS